MFEVGDGVGAAAREALERTREHLVELHAQQHRLLCDIAELERLGVAAETGNRSTGRLVMEIGRVSRAEATRLCGEAADLTARTSLAGEPLPPRYPSTARVYREGRVGPAQVAIIRRTLRRLERVP
ncbi:DUF222 domain-containing protein, partial [Actinomycetospora chlora]|uniref:DUF222 domain-containing protein n=1 Tax=Actinomycetospora chlora TaxID=663608 RepID=UPI0031EECAE6